MADRPGRSASSVTCGGPGARSRPAGQQASAAYADLQDAKSAPNWTVDEIMTSAASYRYPAIQGDDDLGSEFEVEAEAEEEYEEELESALSGHADAEEE